MATIECHGECQTLQTDRTLLRIYKKIKSRSVGGTAMNDGKPKACSQTSVRVEVFFVYSCRAGERNLDYSQSHPMLAV